MSNGLFSASDERRTRRAGSSPRPASGSCPGRPRGGLARNGAGGLFALARDRILSGLGDGMVAVVEPALHRLELTAEVGLIGGEQKSAVAAGVPRSNAAPGGAQPQAARAARPAKAGGG